MQENKPSKFVGVLDREILITGNSEKEILEKAKKNEESWLDNDVEFQIYELKSKYSIKLETKFNFKKI